MFSYDDMRQIIADHLASDANKARALDTAIMAACRIAYERGLADGASTKKDDLLIPALGATGR